MPRPRLEGVPSLFCDHPFRVVTSTDTHTWMRSCRAPLSLDSRIRVAGSTVLVSLRSSRLIVQTGNHRRVVAGRLVNTEESLA